MHPRDPELGTPPRTPAIRRGLTAGAAVGFIATASANSHTNDLGSLVLVALGLLAGAVLATRTSASRAAVLIGGSIALTTLWLLPERDDVGAALVLAVLFGASTLASRVRRVASIEVIAFSFTAVVVLCARVVGSEGDLARVAGVVIVVATIAGVVHPTGARRGRLLVALLVVVTVMFAGYVGAETPGVSWFGGGVTHGPVHGGEVALTFDDGPNLGATLRVMAILDQYGAKGTFFEVGKAIDAAPHITRALYADGQQLGNHSYHHDEWRWLDPRYPELARTQAAFKRAIGECPTFYRPPHGERTPLLARVVHNAHMHIALWSQSAGDWATDDERLVAKRILAGAKPGAILLLHDGLDGDPNAKRDVLVRALPLILVGLRDRGLRSVGLDQLLGRPGYQPCR